MTRWYITYEKAPVTGGFVAYATDRPLPRHASARDILCWPGELHFEYGATIEEAREKLEGSLPS